MWIVMATGRVTQNRTGPEPLRTGSGTGTVFARFRTAEPWNRRKKLHEPDLRTALEPEPEPVRVNRSNGSMELEPGPVRVNRSNGSIEPEPEPVRVNRPSGSMEPEPWKLAVN